MIDSECITPDERFVYQEGLVLLGVVDGEPDTQEHGMAMQDVRQYRSRVSELLAELG
jgi:hypothetical protein